MRAASTDRPGLAEVSAGCVPWPEEFARRYRALGYWEGITLFELLRRAADARPEKVAVVDGVRRCTYAELVARAQALAAGFLDAGLRPGDRVIFQLANGLELIATLFALLRIGVIPVMALPAHRETEIAHFARHARAAALLVPDTARDFDYRRMAQDVASQSPTLRSIIVAGEAAAGQRSLEALARPYTASRPVLDGPGPRASDVALMLLSGGTTGLPKLIPRTHDDYAYNCRQSARVAGLDAGTVFLAVLPMAHNYTLGCPGVLGTLACGGTVVIAPGHAAETVLPLIEAERVTVVSAAVPLVAKWLDSDLLRRCDLGSLRVFMNGGAKLVPELRRRVEARFGCAYQESFGTGEGLLNMTRLDDPEHLRLESSGRPISEADEIKVVDEDGAEVPDGEPGELLCRGPYTVRGYFDAPEINAAAFTPDGYYRTGDIVRKAAGALFLEGRRKDLINRGGEKVSCEEVENHILAHPAVESACVVAMPDPTFGEKACAFVILRAGRTLGFEELAAFLASRGIARFKTPERLEVVETFPISPAGKILRRELRARIAARIAAEQGAHAAR